MTWLFVVVQCLFFKLRMMTPCALCHLDFDIDLSDDDEVQVFLLFDVLMTITVLVIVTSGQTNYGHPM